MGPSGDVAVCSMPPPRLSQHGAYKVGGVGECSVVGRCGDGVGGCGGVGV